MPQQAIKYGWTATALKSTIHKDNVIACGERANDEMISLRYTCDNSIFWLDYQRIKDYLPIIILYYSNHVPTIYQHEEASHELM